MPLRYRPGIPRERLADLLDSAAQLPLTVVCAPAGSGKTTAVADWLASRGRRFTWLAVAAGDNDVVGGISTALADASGEGHSLVLDDYHLVGEPAAHRALRMLLDRLPAVVQVIVISRSPPPLRLGRHRASGALFELGPDDLAFSAGEAEALLNRAFALALGGEQLERVRSLVAGWPAGLALVAASLAAGADREAFERGLELAGDRIGQYLREEVLHGQGPQLREFLLHSSILDRLQPSLCAAVLDDPYAGELLAEVRRDHLLLAEREDGDGSVRYQEPFAALLQRELRAREPELVPLLHARASRWFERAGMLEPAITHASLAGDGSRAAALVHRAGDALLDGRRYRQAWELIEAIPEERGAYGPYCEALALLARSLDRGSPGIVYERLQELRAQNPDAPGLEQLVDRILVSPFFGRVAATAAAGRELFERSAGEPLAERAAIAAKLGIVDWFAGDRDRARSLLEGHLDATAGRWRSMTLAGLALVAADDGQLGLAVARAEAAVAEAELEGGELGLDHVFVHQSLAHALIASGRLEDADGVLARAEEVTAQVPGSLYDGFTLTLRAELELRRRDRERARRAVAAARVAVDRHPDSGVLAAHLGEIEGVLARRGGGELRGSMPTPAERRVLELLARGMTFRQVAAHLYLSIHTVKSHARRLYRRLGVNSREAAVEVARERGLVGDAPPADPLPAEESLPADDPLPAEDPLPTDDSPPADESAEPAAQPPRRSRARSVEPLR